MIVKMQKTAAFFARALPGVPLLSANAEANFVADIEQTTKHKKGWKSCLTIYKSSKRKSVSNGFEVTQAQAIFVPQMLLRV